VAARRLREQRMRSHLVALVIGTGPRPLLGQGAHLPGEGLPDTRRLRRPPGHPEGGAGRPRHACAERRGVPAPHDQIPLPGAGYRPIRPLRRTRLKAQPRGDGAASLRTAPPPPPGLSSVPERLEPRPLERAAGPHLPGRVERLLRDTHRGSIRRLRLQPPGHLLRRPARRPRRGPVGLAGRGRQERPRPLSRAARAVWSSRGPVGAPCPLRPAQCPSDRAGCSCELPSTHAQPAPCRPFAADRLAFGEAHAGGRCHSAQLRSPGVDQKTGVALETCTQGD
jgi:hypothetical protein